MEANELRLGNWVYENGIITEVDYGRMSMAYEYTQHDDFEPIPLNEDWLVDLEFDKALNGYWDKSECFNVKIEDGIFLAYWHGTILCRLDHVHRLQNLYFELMDEELIRKQKQ